MSNRNEVAPGKGFLKVTGVFYIIVGAFSIITSLFLMDTANAISSTGSLFNMPNLGVSDGIQWIAIYNVLVGIFCIIIGILGISYCENLKKATLLSSLAIIDIVLSIISLIAIEFSWTSLIFLALPICFLIGAQKNLGAIGYSTTRKCPFCANDIKKEAIVCQFCGKDLPKEEIIVEKPIEVIANIENDNPDKIKIIIERGNNVICSAIALEIFIDKENVLSVNNNSKNIYFLNKGSHSIYVKKDHYVESETINFDADSSEIIFKLDVLGADKIKLAKL